MNNNQIEKWIYINEAFSALKNKRYKEAIILLENNIDHSFNDPYPFFLLSILYLLTNNFSQAESLTKQVTLIDSEYLPLKELEAFLVLKAVTSSEEAILRYFDLENEYQKNRKYKRIIKKIRTVDDFSKYQKEIKLSNCVTIPKPKKNLVKQALKIHKRSKNKKNNLNKNISNNNRSILNIYEKEKKFKKNNKSKTTFKHKKISKKLIFLIVTIMIIFVAVLLDFKFHLLNNINNYIKISEILNSERWSKETGTDFISIKNNKYSLIDKLTKDKQDIFYYSEKKLKEDFKNIQAKIKDKKYNIALIDLNKIYHSNANLYVKERVNFLRKFIFNQENRKPTNYQYSDISKQPYLYQGVLIKWKGKISNIYRSNNRKTNKIKLLINFDENENYSGIAEVFINAKIDQYSINDIVSVSAIYTNKNKKDNVLYLHAYELEFIER